MSKNVILAGASGLVGSQLLQLLLQHPQVTEVLAPVRRPLPEHPKLKTKVFDFEQDTLDWDVKADALFLCMGTTRSKTPDLAEYHKIDVEYPYRLAQQAANLGIRQLHLVSSVGADEASGNYYLKYKGELERLIRQLKLESIHIYQPSILIGHRKENRPAEAFFQKFMRLIDPLMVGPLKKYKTTPADALARFMLQQLFTEKGGIFVHQTAEIRKA